MGIFTKNKEKMDILQKTQENLELTQKNISLLAAQNQETISENQEVLQRTLTSIETMLGKKIESVSCKKEYSDEEKRRAAYALNCCTISVSQIVDYDDIYVLEQEYESILNNLNLENMPKDEALLDIYKQLLDTITFFRIQEGDKAILEKEYQDKVKNAIWSAVPSISLAGLATNPIGAAINLATQVGIGYMNYRREKAAIQSEQEKQKWQLTRSAMEQFNGLRRELFTTAWRLADEYNFADNLRITEQQIAIFNQILLEPDDLKRYERLDYIKDSFKAYTPFWYHLGNAANKASQNMSEKDAARFKEIAKNNYEEYIKQTDTQKMKLFRHDHIRAACALELFELNGQAEKRLLDIAREAAGSNFDVLEICAMSYLSIGNISNAKDTLRMLVNENYNAVVNGQILSGIYVSEYIKNPADVEGDIARSDYETLGTRVGPHYLFPLPATDTVVNAESLAAEFLKKQKEHLLGNIGLILKALVGKYSVRFNQAIPVTNQAEINPEWYFSDNPEAIKRRKKEVERVFGQNGAAQSQYINRLGLAISDKLDSLNELCVAIEGFPYVSEKVFAYKIQEQVEQHKDVFSQIIDKVANDQFSRDDIPLLFEHSFSDLISNAVTNAIKEFYDTIKELKEMEDVSKTEMLLRSFCAHEELSVPFQALNSSKALRPTQNKNRYISLDTLDMDKEELKEELDRVHNMKITIYEHIKKFPLVRDKEKKKMVELQDKDVKFASYCSTYLNAGYLARYYGEPLLILCYDNKKTKNSTSDLIFTSKGIEYFSFELFRKNVHHFPIPYSKVNIEKDKICIGRSKIELSSDTFNANNIHELINKLKEQECVAVPNKGNKNPQEAVQSELTDVIDKQIAQLTQELEI